MWNLADQRILITGGTKGIGRAAVTEMLKLGAKVLFTARNKEEIISFEQELKAEGYPATGVVSDIASVAGFLDVQTGSPYAMSKAGLIQQTKSLAAEWAKDGIRVNALSPWFTETPLTEGLLLNKAKVQDVLSRTPMQRVARAEEMATIIVFLAMKQSSYITGQNIIADGGMSATALLTYSGGT